MTDRELLELAAKAAGLKKTTNCLDEMSWTTGLGSGCFAWNPLTDDGDALRLAIELRLEVSFFGTDEDGSDSQACAGIPLESDPQQYKSYVFENHNKDIFAATRRAIVRAAAAIGKELP